MAGRARTIPSVGAMVGRRVEGDKGKSARNGTASVLLADIDCSMPELLIARFASGG